MSKNSQKPEGELPPQKISTEFEKEIYEFPKEVNLLLKAVSQVPTDEPFKKQAVEDQKYEATLAEERIKKSIESLLEQEQFKEILPNLPKAGDYSSHALKYDLHTVGITASWSSSDSSLED